MRSIYRFRSSVRPGYVGLRRALPAWAAAAVSAALFAWIHGSALAFAPLFALGVLLALAYERSGTLLVPVYIHAFFNATSLAFLIAL